MGLRRWVTVPEYLPQMKLFLLAFGLLPGAALAQNFTPIGTLQGSGPAATAGPATVRGVVTAVYPNLNPAGYYVQNEAADADGNPATSDAVFVAQANPTVAIGDRLALSGTVQEDSSFPSFGQAVLTAATATVLATGVAQPAFALLDNATFVPAADAEAVEGMRVRFTASISVSDVGAVRSRGELRLSLRGPVYQPTQVVDPNDSPASGTASSGNTNAAAVTAYGAANAAKLLLLDDGRATVNPVPTPYLDPALGTVRVGSTVTDLRGILAYGGNQWRVQPLPGADAPALAVQRPAVPVFARPAEIRVASFNIENYFNGNGLGQGFPTSRGALTYADYRRQRAKILVALAQLNADAVALMEVENDGTGPQSAVQDLVNGLNQAAGASTYAFVNDGGATRQAGNGDAIHCAIIYKLARLQPVGPALLALGGPFERPPLAQVFATRPAAGTVPADTFALVANHFKSKASGSGANADQGDGQGPSNLRRRLQAAALAQFITTTVVPAGNARVLAVGDYNAAFEEDPLDVLRAAGLVPGTAATSTSYVFSGQRSALDHALYTAALVGRAEVLRWGINGEEPAFLDYAAAGPATDTTSAFRTSDHDPILIGLTLSGRPSATATPGTAGPAPQLHVFPNPTSGAFGFRLANLAIPGPFTLELFNSLGQSLVQRLGTLPELQSELLRHTAALPAGAYLVRLRGGGVALTQRVTKE